MAGHWGHSGPNYSYNTLQNVQERLKHLNSLIIAEVSSKVLCSKIVMSMIRL